MGRDGESAPEAGNGESQVTPRPILGVALFAAVVAFEAAHPRGQATRAVTEVSGVVMTADAPARPVRGAVVTFSVDGGPGSAGWWERTVGDVPATLTDDDGRFRLAGLPAGRYRVSAAKPPFLATEFGALR